MFITKRQLTWKKGDPCFYEWHVKPSWPTFKLWPTDSWKNSKDLLDQTLTKRDGWKLWKEGEQSECIELLREELTCLFPHSIISFGYLCQSHSSICQTRRLVNIDDISKENIQTKIVLSIWSSDTSEELRKNRPDLRTTGRVRRGTLHVRNDTLRPFRVGCSTWRCSAAHGSCLGTARKWFGRIGITHACPIPIHWSHDHWPASVHIRTHP